MYQLNRWEQSKLLYTRSYDATRMEALDVTTKFLMTRCVIPSIAESMLLNPMGGCLRMLYHWTSSRCPLEPIRFLTMTSYQRRNQFSAFYREVDWISFAAKVIHYI